VQRFTVVRALIARARPEDSDREPTTHRLPQPGRPAGS